MAGAARLQPGDGQVRCRAWSPRVGDDPLIVAGSFGKGRGVAFTSDCGPHWAPPPFVDWSGYAPLWNGIAEWAGRLTMIKVQQPPDPWQRTTTEHGFPADEVISALQKCIRRGLSTTPCCSAGRCI